MQTPEIVKLWPADGISRIKSETMFGNIHIKGHEADEIRIELLGKRYGWQFWNANRSLQSVLHDYDITIEKKAETLLIKVSLKSGSMNWLRFTGIHFQILLPRKRFFETDIRLEAGNIHVEGCAGKHDIATSAGTIRLENVQGSVNGSTSAGTVDIRNCKANISIETSAGAIEARNCEGTLTLTTSGGTIELNNIVGNAYATTSAGTIEARDIDGVLKASTSAGAIEVLGMNGSLGAFTNLGTIDVELLSFGAFLNLESQAGNISVQMPLDKGLGMDISGIGIRVPRLPHFEGVYERNRIDGKNRQGGIPARIRAQAGIVKIRHLHGNSLDSFRKTWKKESFNLPSSYFHFNLKGLLLSLVVCIMLTYGVSSLLFLGLELSSNKEMSAVYLGVIIGHIVNGLLVLALVYVFTRYLVQKIRQSWIQYLVLNILALLVSILAQIILFVSYWRSVEPPQGAELPASQMLAYLFIPCFVASIYFFFWQRSQQITRKISEQEFQLLNMEKLKTRAELDALQARINPHFLYNALNSIAGLVHEDADKAETMTLLLSKLFRFTIGTKDQHFNTVEHELEVVQTYLDIEKVRFGKRLSYSLETEEGLSQIRIPGFLLQPVVENAIKHGISRISGEGRIDVKISKSGDQLICSIHDNGPDFPPNFFTGYGLQSIQDKLNLLYGDRASLDIQNNDYKQVIIQLPC